MLSGGDVLGTSTLTRIPTGPSVGSSMIRRSCRLTSPAPTAAVHLRLADDRPQRGLRLLGHREQGQFCTFTVALIGSTTRRITTRIHPDGHVIPGDTVLAGTAIATICMLTFCSRSPTGRITVSPQNPVPGRTLPNLEDQGLFVLLHNLQRPAATAPPMIKTMRMTRRIPRPPFGTPLLRPKSPHSHPQPSDNSPVHDAGAGRERGGGRAGPIRTPIHLADPPHGTVCAW